MSERRGPLVGLRVLEVAGVGPAPFAAMMLADLGAHVVKVERASTAPGHDPAARLRDVMAGMGDQSPDGAGPAQPLDRGRRAVGINLKDPEGVSVFLTLAAHADVLIEGFRPGVMERLGVGPADCHAMNPSLVYARVTGWGSDGPLAMAPGHDINYIALTGALEAMGPADRPPSPPLSLLGDFAGGAMLLAFGVLAGVLEARTSGRGQVVDAAMLDGAALLSTVFHGLRAQGLWRDERGTNVIDGAAHFYGTYECADGAFLAVGAIEPQFYAAMVAGFGLDDPDLAGHFDPSQWPALREQLAGIILTRTRDEWCALLEGTDACVAPVLSFADAPEHAHNRARAAYLEVDGVVQPGVAPRFARTPGAILPSASVPSLDESLREFGLTPDRIVDLRRAGVLS